MSSVTVRINGNELDLWTNIDQWNPREKFINNQPYSQLPKELVRPFYNFKEDEVAQLNSVKYVTVPFAYWKRGNPDCPNRGSAFTQTKWNDGANPDVMGRIRIPIENAPDGYYGYAYTVKSESRGVDVHPKVLRDIGYTLGSVQERIKQLEGFRSRIFSTFIPVSCKGVANTIKSLFPWTAITYRYDWTTPIRFIADIITLPVRLLTLGPRCIYQNAVSKPGIPFDAHSDKTIDWNSGAFYLFSAYYGTGNPNSDNRGGAPAPLDYLNCLGSGEGKTIYFG